jgi:hypothetical protein
MDPNAQRALVGSLSPTDASALLAKKAQLRQLGGL